MPQKGPEAQIKQCTGPHTKHPLHLSHYNHRLHALNQSACAERLAGEVCSAHTRGIPPLALIRQIPLHVPLYPFVILWPWRLRSWPKPAGFHVHLITLRRDANGWWPVRRFDIWPALPQTHSDAGRPAPVLLVVLYGVLGRCWDNYSNLLNNNEQHADDRCSLVCRKGLCVRVCVHVCVCVCWHGRETWNRIQGLGACSHSPSN